MIVGGMKDADSSLVRKTIFKPFLKCLGIEKNVIYAGIVSKKDLVHYYNLCDIFILVSKEIKRKNKIVDVEGFGIVYLEANACGKPVIASKSGGIPEAVIDAKTGLLVEPDNIIQTRGDNSPIKR